MKFGVISYEKKPLRLDGRDEQNIGDWLQMFAMEEIYEEFGITEDELIHISRNELDAYRGEYACIPMNMFYSFFPNITYNMVDFSFESHIIPLFFGFNCSVNGLSDSMKKYLSYYGSVGCRDEETMQNMRKQGVPAYLTGCISSLIEKRSSKVSENAKKIIFVDVPQSVEQYIPEDIRGEAEYRSNVYKITRTTGEKFMTEEEAIDSARFAKEQYEYIFNNAKLVVTSRLHVASPCIARGIPVIIFRDNIDGRFSWLDKYVPIYQYKDYEKIDWNPKPVEYEDEKKQIKALLKRKLFELYDKHKDEISVSELLENREKIVYNKAYKEELKKLCKLGNDIKYVIWGSLGKTGILKHCIEEVYPNWELLNIYDKNVRGYFEEIVIKSSDEITEDDDIVYFIMSPLIKKAAMEKLAGCKVIFCYDEANGWETTL